MKKDFIRGFWEWFKRFFEKGVIWTIFVVIAGALPIIIRYFWTHNEPGLPPDFWHNNFDMLGFCITLCIAMFLEIRYIKVPHGFSRTSFYGILLITFGIIVLYLCKALNLECDKTIHHAFGTEMANWDYRERSIFYMSKLIAIVLGIVSYIFLAISSLSRPKKVLATND